MCLLPKHEDQSSEPKTLAGKSGLVDQCWEEETGRSLGLAVQPSLAYLESSQ